MLAFLANKVQKLGNHLRGQVIQTMAVLWREEGRDGVLYLTTDGINNTKC